LPGNRLPGRGGRGLPGSRYGLAKSRRSRRQAKQQDGERTQAE